MAKQLQVILRDPEYLEIQQAALSAVVNCGMGTTNVSSALSPRLLRRVEKKLGAIRAAAQYEFPTADLETMLAEIEQGYLSDPQP
jgi:hypothetical protein